MDAENCQRGKMTYRLESKIMYNINDNMETLHTKTPVKKLLCERESEIKGKNAQQFRKWW